MAILALGAWIVFEEGTDALPGDFAAQIHRRFPEMEYPAFIRTVRSFPGPLRCHRSRRLAEAGSRPGALAFPAGRRPGGPRRPRAPVQEWPAPAPSAEDRRRSHPLPRPRHRRQSRQGEDPRRPPRRRVEYLRHLRPRLAPSTLPATTPIEAEAASPWRLHLPAGPGRPLLTFSAGTSAPCSPWKWPASSVSLGRQVPYLALAGAKARRCPKQLAAGKNR